MAIKKESIFSDIDVRKLNTYTTAVGELAIGYITEPSKEYDERGQYFIRLKFPAESKEAKRLIKLIDEAAQIAYDMAQERITNVSERKKLKRADPSYGMVEDAEGNETGEVYFNFKRRAVRYDKQGEEKPVKLPVFDSLGQPVETEGLDIWGGSEIAVAFKLIPFYTAGVGVGVSHRIEAVQIVKVVSAGSRTAEEFGFTKHEGAFNAAKAEDEEESDGNDGTASAAEEEIAEEDEDYFTKMARRKQREEGDY